MNFPTAFVIVTALIVGYLTYSAHLDHKVRVRRLEARSHAGEDFTRSTVTNNAYPISQPDWQPVNNITVLDMNHATLGEVADCAHVHDQEGRCLKNRDGDLCVSVV